ncbi:amino acid adenylation domain-containing protein [Glycomyces buryatensis]|uniref:Amino acid adenylation domain-containing protein n=1 Tax=Glycomyces buryatensis TaxID=2570927 RepID=A0A4S8QD33_9ACTN|nr:amino acid adenylation domain-containing protein [Glycomyces buryatensis]THV42210.1 amino acid adenylation domain-containing protein [Glycomyces buryatensis]
MSFNSVASQHPPRIPVQTGLPDLLHEQARLRPDDTAVESGDGDLTYGDLVSRSSELAGLLNHLGVGADDRVGLFAEPSLDLMIGVWGILFSGGAYLPLSPDYPQDRIRYMIQDSGLDVIVTQQHLVDDLRTFAPQATRIVTLDEAEGFPGARPSGPGSSDLAYVIYTSGSTGKPKGVMIEHRSIVSQMRWMRACGHLGDHSRVLQKTPVSFDAAQWEILAPAVGAQVVMGAPGVYRDVEALIAAIDEHRVTTLQCVPTLLEALTETAEFSRCTSLRQVFSGGEALPRRLAAAYFDALPWSSLVNLYGPTECTINATSFLTNPTSLDEDQATVPIGVPADNTQCFILDANLAPTDIGETGELYIGGIQVARGYLNRPDQTEERFVPSPFVPTQRLYRTGDLASWNPDGTISFSGRADNQVKLRGHRIELEEIARTIEEHTWVKRAAAIVADDDRTGSQNLVACVELNPKEAALMDQGSHGEHHQSKSNKLQVKTQLSDPGVRDPEELRGRTAIALPGNRETERQRRTAFGRKTYRFYEGGDVTRGDLLTLLATRPLDARPRGLGELTLDELGRLLRWFGQYRSDERLLPKYTYASPGSLYATQLYLETTGAAGLDPGMYYYHPVDHALVRIGDAAADPDRPLSVHFIGKRRAIEPVYKNNIREVLEFETGHMLGVFEEVLPEYGLNIRPVGYRPSAKERTDVADEDYYLGTFEIGPAGGEPRPDLTEIYVQIHPGRVDGMRPGQYRYSGGDLVRVSDEIVQAKHVIAINQQVYDRASFGITAVSRETRGWLEYIGLGAKLHHLQRNGIQIGLMSSGYSSKTGHPLPAARRMDDILSSLGIAPGPSYFCIGGKVTDEQIGSEGMREDTVHMHGPAELIKDELARTLPHFMIPSQVLVLDALPLTANGKIDHKALAASDRVRSVGTGVPHVAPATRAERWLAHQWGEALRYEHVSVEDEFFASGGNSLIAVMLVNRINREFGTRLPLQVVFESPKLRDLASRIENDTDEPSSRMVPLHLPKAGSPVFCWPGLGGYPMNLRLLAREASPDRPFYGVQAQGINPGEVPLPTIREMAAADVSEIRRIQPEGPYSLWGYSFGARVAFETAWQLEQRGEQVEHLLLICPGNPRTRLDDGRLHGREASYSNPAYVSILFSVFSGVVEGPAVERCLKEARDEVGFVSYVHELYPDLDEPWIRRITRIVEETFEFEYTFRELTERRLNAPVVLLKATGDDYSFLEGRSGYSAAPPVTVDLEGDHYSVLKEHGVAELATAIRETLDRIPSPRLAPGPVPRASRVPRPRTGLLDGGTVPYTIIRPPSPSA